jgi:hypothetical protein
MNVRVEAVYGVRAREPPTAADRGEIALLLYAIRIRSSYAKTPWESGSDTNCRGEACNLSSLLSLRAVGLFLLRRFRAALIAHVFIVDLESLLDLRVQGTIIRKPVQC